MLTITEALHIPKGMDFSEYENLLEEKKKLENQIKRANLSIYEEEDSLGVLADEAGSKRYNIHLRKKHISEEQIQKAKERLGKIEEKLQR